MPDFTIAGLEDEGVATQGTHPVQALPLAAGLLAELVEAELRGLGLLEQRAAKTVRQGGSQVAIPERAQGCARE